VPKFISGEGAIIRIDTRIDANKNTLPVDYLTYATYDQGRIMTKAILVFVVLARVVQLEDREFLFWDLEYRHSH